MEMDPMDIEEEGVMDSGYPPCNWSDKFDLGTLTFEDFKAFWRLWVPRYLPIYPKNKSPNIDRSAEKVKKKLIQPLENFLSAGEGKHLFTKLTETKRPPAVCGRVLKNGEPVYFCRECGMDNTCVLCVDCFKQSAHRHHKYRMGTSGGGGYCDCGDEEAWSSDHYCDYHLAGVQNKSENQAALHPETMRRCELAFEAVLKYAYTVLTIDAYPALPHDLKPTTKGEGIFSYIGSTDSYCTILYNDETHTFDQVISTLAKVIKCSQKDSIDLVTNIDGEGRAVVMTSSFHCCQVLKTEIERFTSRHGTVPLQTHVVHSHLVANQVFSLRLLEWLRNLVSLNESFRQIFSRVAMTTTPPQVSVIEGILLRDSTLWKSARIHWHRLIISAMFMEYDNKKEFAKVLTKNYGNVMKDFIRDDHDHTFSVSSLSLQVFTVPSLAHSLIAEANVMLVLLNTFLSECSRKCNKNGNLEFQRNSPMPFKRAIYILHDLRYLMISVPKEWTIDLRRGFLQGVALILKLLSYIQGMDPVVRQVGQHMEYEPEWESAFNLLIRLAPVITLAIQWCASDKVVLVKAYRLTLKQLASDKMELDKNLEVRELADHSASCIPYNVSSQPVSIHLPLSRFLAGLHVHLWKYKLTFDSPELQTDVKLTPVEIIEPVLRAQVMIAQVHAGMWRRNGYAIANQIYFYHSAKCRSEMLDRDIVLLQIGASLIESNEFLIHILNKFNLLSWANPQFETKILKGTEDDGLRQVICLVEEFLNLIIDIFGERYHPGVGDVTSEDCLKKEIIQQLCIKPLSHSELNSTLPNGLNFENEMEKVISDVAIFKRPGSSSSGIYELKPEMSDQYNVFFYHYTKEELSKSEEVQRKKRKAATGLECCPPPILPKLTEPFSMVANIIQCDVMLHVMQTVLERATNLRARTFSEGQVQKVLHLIGYALQEEEQKNYDFFKFTSVAERWGIEPLLNQLVGNARIDAHKDLLKWVISKYKQVTSSNATDDNTMDEEAVAEQQEKQQRAKLAAERRAKIMDQMAAMQKSFMKSNAQMFDEAITSEETEAPADPCEVEVHVALGKKEIPLDIKAEKIVCILCQEASSVTFDGPALVLAGFIQKSSVLARNREEDLVESLYERKYPMLLTPNLGPTPYISSCGHIMHASCWQKYFENIMGKENRRPYRPRQPGSFDVEKNEFLCPLCECLNNTVLPLFPPFCTLPSKGNTFDRLGFESWIRSSLTAINHKKKWDAEREANEAKSKAENIADGEGVSRSKTGESASKRKREQPASENLANLDSIAADPFSLSSPSTSDTVSPPVSSFLIARSPSNATGEGAVAPFKGIVDAGYETLVMELTVSPGSKDELSTTDDEEAYDLNRLFSMGLFEMIILFAQAIFTKGLELSPHEDDPGIPLITWKSCAYTIHSVEQMCRVTNKPLFGNLAARVDRCLQSLVKISGVLGAVWKYNEVINRHGVRVLAYVIDNVNSDLSIVDWDCFGMLVHLTASLPNMFSSDPLSLPLGGVLELNTFHLMLVCQIAQILVNIDLAKFACDEDEEGPSGSQDTQVLFELTTLLKDCKNLQTDKLWSKIKEEVTPFLRCSALFYRYLTDIVPSNALNEVSGETFDNLCSYLGVSSSCYDLLCKETLGYMFEKWGEHKKIVELRHLKEPRLYRSLLTVNELVRLPDDYCELINAVSFFTCPNSDKEDSRNPTMCLVCGKMLCSQTYCCQAELINKLRVGACTYHAQTCGLGAGIFLRVRDCEILLLATPNRGCFKTPPYLDSYGETDQGLRRGNPLHLSVERYKKLQTIWLSHTIYEEIARAIESSQNLINTQWQNL